MAVAKHLEAYHRKRDFTVTNEPRGRGRAAAKGKALSYGFVVQKHAARRLHYDFRLELDGVLKSWAIAKGPSLVPGEKRLAVHVEDHPLDYGSFEGIIPEGQYGAGSVIVWDRGTWRPEGDPHEALAKGHLNFELQGEKLRGAWHLVRMRAKEGMRGDNWLLIKSHDAAARTADEPDILLEMPDSVQSGRPIEKIDEDPAPREWTDGKPASTRAPAAGGRMTPRQLASAPLETDPIAQPAQEAAATKILSESAFKPSSRLLDIEIPTGAQKTAALQFITPCLATLVAAPPKTDAYVHEVKFDGYRLQLVLRKGKAIIHTRGGLDWTERFPLIAEAAAALPVESAVFDGEAIVEDKNGVADFVALQEALKTGQAGLIVFYAFDLLYLKGYDLRPLPLLKRKALLEILLAQDTTGILRYSAHFETPGDTLFKYICQLGAEGLVSKRADLPYHSGRSTDWLKAKCTHRQEFVIIGYVPSTSLPKAIGSLVLGYYDQGKLFHAGRAGTGYSRQMATDLRQDLETIKLDISPVEGPLSAEAKKNVRWVKPLRVAEIEFRGWTNDALLRQAAFKALREDKPPQEIVREDKNLTADDKTDNNRERTSVKLTHADRLLWPQLGITKQALADYYTSIWPWIEPHITGRPLALVRCPQGIDHDCFFQKHQWAGHDMHIDLIEDPNDDKPLISVNDLDGLIALAQASVLEIHPWGSRTKSLEKPDRLIFDLDPGENIGFADLAMAARAIRERLMQDGLKSFVKVTGGKGLHVVVPLVPEAGWEEAKVYCRIIAQDMAAASPDHYTATMSKRARTGKIFVDYLRNARGATAIAPYSTRAREACGIATPLAWEELDTVTSADQFTLTNLERRLRNLCLDPWAEMAKLEQTLPKLIGDATRASTS
jgi:bifunctional non-homologous end joining protein LigD